MRAPPRKYNDFDGFGRPLDRIGPTGTQRHDKHVRPPAGFSATCPTRLARSGARRIEPAEPEPPPAHSLGRVDEDVMGRSGQLVRPRSLDAGGVTGGE